MARGVAHWYSVFPVEEWLGFAPTTTKQNENLNREVLFVRAFPQRTNMHWEIYRREETIKANSQIGHVPLHPSFQNIKVLSTLMKGIQHRARAQIFYYLHFWALAAQHCSPA